jgi:hypothetical protein
MVRHTALLGVLLLVSVALAPAAAGPPPALAQFLASLQPAAPAAPGVFAPLASAPPAVPTCTCLVALMACCRTCSGTSNCAGNPTCQSQCADAYNACICRCNPSLC